MTLPNARIPVFGAASHDGLPIDLNADLGEGFGAWTMADDAAMLDVVTSANVACGFHAGDPKLMRQVCEHAVEGGVAIGAHVSFRDLAGFGRRNIDMDPDVLADEILYQIGSLDAFARAAGDRVSYVKPHGALYNRAVNDDVYAEAIVRAISDYEHDLAVLTMPGSELFLAAQAAELIAVPEGFIDRAYLNTGDLAARSAPGSVINDLDSVLERGMELAINGSVTAVDGSVIPLDPRSLCLHSDTPGAIALALNVRRTLIEHGIRLGPFAQVP